VIAQSSNHFLASLPRAAHDVLRPHLRSRELPQAAVIYNAGDTVSEVIFPYSGIVSFVVGMENGQFVEAEMIGWNGVVGAGPALDGRRALNRAVVHAAGRGAAIEAETLTQLVRQNEGLRRTLADHEHMLFAYVQQIAACNAVHALEARMSRWLLQVRDLVRSDELPLTQEFMAQMLGVQRTSVTLIVGRLQQAGLIKTRRGRVAVIDLEGLRDAACECYRTTNAHFSKLVGWKPNSGTSTTNRDGGQNGRNSI
jgi:CRP-like cAMP-binding protein